MLRALFHVSLPALLLCVAAAHSGVFGGVAVDLTHEHYAEPPVARLPGFLGTMPCNSLVNLGYVLLGLYWLLPPRRGGGGGGGGEEEERRTAYLREVFAFMALFYAPVQWTRLATLRRAPAVLDQWVTLPIFAWVSVWCDSLQQGAAWSPWRAAVGQLCSVLSYGLALVHPLGFEAALAGHVALAVCGAQRLQCARGDARSRRYLGLAVASCAGFVVLKLLDHHMARYRLFQRLTGHFWSKVCDVAQFHYSFCFLTSLAAGPSDMGKKK